MAAAVLASWACACQPTTAQPPVTASAPATTAAPSATATTPVASTPPPEAGGMAVGDSVRCRFSEGSGVVEVQGRVQAVSVDRLQVADAAGVSRWLYTVGCARETSAASPAPGATAAAPPTAGFALADRVWCRYSEGSRVVEVRGRVQSVSTDRLQVVDASGTSRWLYTSSCQAERAAAEASARSSAGFVPGGVVLCRKAGLPKERRVRVQSMSGEYLTIQHDDGLQERVHQDFCRHPPGSTPPPKPVVEQVVMLRNGTRLTGQVIETVGGRLRLKLSTGELRDIAVAEVLNLSHLLPRAPDAARSAAGVVIQLADGSSLAGEVLSETADHLQMRLSTGQVRTILKAQIAKLPQVVSEAVPEEASAAAQGAYGTVERGEHLQERLGHVREEGITGQERAQRAQEFTQEVQQSQQEHVGQAGQMMDFAGTSKSEDNVSTVYFYGYGGFDDWTFGDGKLGGITIGSLLGYAPLNYPNTRVGLAGDIGYAFIAVSAAGTETTHTTSSAVFWWDARLQARFVKQAVRAEFGAYGVDGDCISQVDRTDGTGRETQTSFSLSSRGLVAALKVALCTSDNPRCPVDWWAGLERFMPLAGAVQTPYYRAVLGTNVEVARIVVGFPFAVEVEDQNPNDDLVVETGWGWFVHAGLGFSHDFE